MPKVLIIEDDQAYRKVYTRKFEVAGFTVQTAENGVVGLEKMRTFMPDVVFTDLMMPHLDGFSVLDTAAQDPMLKSIPIVVLSNLSTPEDTDKVIQKGAKGLLVKSDIDPSQAVDKALELIKPSSPTQP